MTMAEIKNLYICCEEGREEFFQEKAKDIYKEYICIQDEIGKDTAEQFSCSVRYCSLRSQ